MKNIPYPAQAKNIKPTHKPTNQQTSEKKKKTKKKKTTNLLSVSTTINGRNGLSITRLASAAVRTANCSVEMTSPLKGLNSTTEDEDEDDDEEEEEKEATRALTGG